MPVPDLSEILLEWLRIQRFTPAPRITRCFTQLPPAAYPCVSVIPRDTSFTQDGTDIATAIMLRVDCAAGRLADAQMQARGLAWQLRSALHRSHGLAGAVRAVRTEGIDYSQQEGPGGMVSAAAVLHVVLLAAADPGA